MVATGRVPNTKTLGLENMGIETNRGFVQARYMANLRRITLVKYYDMCTNTSWVLYLKPTVVLHYCVSNTFWTTVGVSISAHIIS